MDPCHGTAITRHEVLVDAVTWRDLKTVLPSERHQTQKATYITCSVT